MDVSLRPVQLDVVLQLKQKAVKKFVTINIYCSKNHNSEMLISKTNYSVLGLTEVDEQLKNCK